ncbi:hypothetical protein HMPREF9441_03238 [Paraprevotella clara YIT 11840]|uniref:Uncharacterized protein n=1 Tax=Paraprevotella clara YIT 11840 TaxID=762968 RepID=G5SV24_9BACT|nr:hypothetical protein HMPREF9441_03238 [Paraprevotella clara YIT 11840]
MRYRQDLNLHELSALSNPSGWVKLQYSSCVYQFRHGTVCPSYPHRPEGRCFN